MSTLSGEIIKRAMMDGARGTPVAAMFSHLSAPRKEIGLALESLITSRRLLLRGGYYFLPPRPAAIAPSPVAPVVATQEKPVSVPATTPASQKHCPKCDKDLALTTCFSTDKSTRDGKSRWCIGCQAEDRRKKLQEKNMGKGQPAAKPAALPDPPAPIVAHSSEEIPTLVSIAAIVIQIPGLPPAQVTIKQASDLYSQLQAVLARVA